MANDITIRIGAEAKDVKAGFGDVRGEISGLKAAIQQLNSAITSLTAPLQTALEKIAEAAKGTSEAAEGAGKHVKDVSEGAAKVADGVTAGFKAVGKEIPEVGKIIEGLGVVVEGFFALCESMSDKLGKSWTDNEAAMTSLKETMKDALAPTLAVILDGITSLTTAFVRSYKEGGIVSTVMSALGDIFKVLIAIVVGLGTAFDFVVETVDGAAWAIAGIIEAAFSVIEGEIKIAMTAWNSLGTIMKDVLTLNWGSITSDFKAGMDAITQTALKSGHDAANAVKTGFKTGAAEWASADSHANAADAFIDRLMAPPTAPGKKTASGANEAKSGTDRSTSSPSASAGPAASNGVGPWTPKGVEQAQGAANQIVAITTTATNQIVTINAQGEAKVQKADKAAVQDTQSRWKGVADAIAGAWSQSLAGMIKGTQNFRGMMLSIGNAILGEATKWIEKKASAFIAKELTQTAAVLSGTASRNAIEASGAATSIGISATTSLAEIAHSAAVAASRAYKVIAGIQPYGPFIAPVVAAAALAGVMAFGKSVFSAEGGMGQVPYDGAMFELHKDEMVLPASLATPMRSMLAKDGTKGIAFAANDAGTTHNHYYNISAMDGQDVHRVLMRHHGSVARAAERAYRNGYAVR